MKFIKKHWFIIAIIIVSIIRFLFTFKLPNFYLSNLGYDDGLMIRNFNFLRVGKYLGETYYKTTLVKGPLFSFIMFIINLYKINYSSIFTLLYILASLFLTLSLKEIIKEKKYLFIIYVILLFNPVTYSQDLFQRLYRNSISITEFIFFFATVIRVLFAKDKKILNYCLMGISLTLMFLTREDNIWTYPVLAFIFIYTIYKSRNIKTILLNIIPFIILIGSLNVISYVNYKHYGIYTYNEIQKSEFHNTYKKILQIKDDKKIDNVSIPKSTLYKLAENSKSFKLTKEDLDKYYKKLADENGEINNGNIMWYLRDMIYCKNKFKTGKESEKYYKKLGKELDQLFKDGTLEKEFIMPSIFMNVPTKKDLLKIPGNLLYAIGYTTTYQDIKTMTDTRRYLYNKVARAYYFDYADYHNTINIVKNNGIVYEEIRLIYKYFTIIFSIIALIIYFKNILKFDNMSITCHILLVMYLLIIGGVTYTHTTSFHAIRPLYLGNIYIIQNLFILINLCRIDYNKLLKTLKKQVVKR